MGARFWRRVRIFPGVTLNFSLYSTSVSFGPRGLKITIGGNGVRFTIGGLGTGLFWTEQLRATHGGKLDKIG